MPPFLKLTNVIPPHKPGKNILNAVPFLIEGPTFAKFLFQNTKPIITLPPSLLKCCIENKANIALHWPEINII